MANADLETRYRAYLDAQNERLADLVHYVQDELSYNSETMRRRQSLGLAGGRPRWFLVGESDGSTAQHPLRLCRIAGHPELAVIDQRLSQQLGS
jgi:hypothetical protein